MQMSNTTEKAEPNERQSKSKGETGRPTLSERQGTTGRRKEKDGEKAKKESTNPEAKDPHTRYFTRLGIVHKTEAQSRSLARHSVHVGPYNRHAVKGKPRRGGSVLASSAHATDPVREGGGGRTQRDPLPPAGLLVDGACAQPPVSGESCHDLPSMERAPATTETHRGGGAGADLSTTGSDLGSGAPTGGGIVRSASTQALWTPSGDRTDAQQQLLRREKWFSLTEFPPSSILSPNRFSTGLEQIQNETASVKAGLLVEPGVSMVHVPRPRVRSSSQPPKSGVHYMECYLDFLYLQHHLVNILIPTPPYHHTSIPSHHLNTSIPSPQHIHTITSTHPYHHLNTSIPSHHLNTSIPSPQHIHTITSPQHIHTITSTHPYHHITSTHPYHHLNTSIPSPQHIHTITSPQHIHTITSPQHIHTITSTHPYHHITSHIHAIISPQHIHTITSPQHIHTITSPQHIHTITSPHTSMPSYHLNTSTPSHHLNTSTPSHQHIHTITSTHPHHHLNTSTPSPQHIHTITSTHPHHHLNTSTPSPLSIGLAL